MYFNKKTEASSFLQYHTFSNHIMSPKVFFITGTSTGFGHELVQVVLEKGDIAVATARDPSKLKFEGMCMVFLSS